MISVRGHLSWMVPGFIYIFLSTDPLMFNRIKVGLSVDCEVRRRQLYTSGVAMPFYLAYSWDVSNMHLAESIAHKTLDGHRVNGYREFFDVYPPEGCWEEFGNSLPPNDFDTVRIGLACIVEAIEVEFQTNRTQLDFQQVDVDALPDYSKYRQMAMKNGAPASWNLFAEHYYDDKPPVPGI